MEVKQICAKAALDYIKDGMAVGLGGGSTIKYLAQYIKDGGYDLKIVTPSIRTQNLCESLNLEIIPISLVSRIDIAFDGCDEVDLNFNALKSNGGMHTLEKVIADLADEYILLVDDSKISEKLSFKYPVVLDIINESKGLTEKKIKELGGKFSLREAVNEDELLINNRGRLLVEAYFENIEDINKLYRNLKNITGVIEISLFCGNVTKVISVGEKAITVWEGKK